MQEIWKDIKGYEGLYQVSNMGKVKSLKRDVMSKGKLHQRKPERFLPLKKRNKERSYLCVDLYKDNMCKRFSVHRLVAMTYIPNPNGLPQVNHIDGNKQNNEVNNLEWCTQSYNMKEAYRTGLEKPTNTSSVIQYDKNMVFLNKFNTIKDAQKIYGKINISGCCRKERKTAGGYIWRYADN